MEPRVLLPRRALTLLILLIISVLTSSGCSLVYRTSHTDEHFVLYADRDDAFVERTARRTREIFAGFREIFDMDANDLDDTWIFLDGEDDATIDYNYAPDLLGYYVPFFRVIRIDTRPPMTSKAQGLEQVLLHEIAHHFIVAEYPEATNECWLNEGLAGCLEVTVVEDGHVATPLLNPVLANLARRALREPESTRRLGELVRSDWEEFHTSDSREQNYALAWSAVYYLLTRHLPQDLSLGERIEKLYTLDRDSLAKLAPDWRRFVRQLRPVDELERWAAEWAGAPGPRRLRASWAIRQLGETRGLEGVRALERLVSLVENESRGARQLAALSLLRLLDRTPHVAVFAADTAMRGLDHVRSIIASPHHPAPLRSDIVQAVSASHVTHDAWLPVLVDALDESSPRVRAAAATALSRLEIKPTIANPAFWAEAPSSAREREVREWRDWLESSDEKLPSLAR